MLHDPGRQGVQEFQLSSISCILLALAQQLGEVCNEALLCVFPKSCMHFVSGAH